MSHRLRCHVTVAAVIANGGRFLFVEEQIQGQRVLNQPAGHLEAGEDLLQAVVREVLEETSLEFLPDAWLGCDLLQLPNDAVTLRVAFTGPTRQPVVPVARDPVIVATHWLTAEEAAAGFALRSPLVQRSLQRFEAGVRLPLAALGGLVQHWD